MFEKPTLIPETQAYADHRGMFYESYKKSTFEKQYRISETFVQDNHSVSKKNVVRGLHYQWDPPMGKLVRVVKGEILDVIVDIRKDSTSFGKVQKFVLTENNRAQLYVPCGFAHGFVSRTEESIVLYKCTAEYNKDGESAINPFDSTLNIDWGVPIEKAIVSQKDWDAKTFQQFVDE